MNNSTPCGIKHSICSLSSPRHQFRSRLDQLVTAIEHSVARRLRKNRNFNFLTMFKKMKIIFSFVLFFQALLVVYSMTALEQPYEYIQCKLKNRRDGHQLKNRHLRSLLDFSGRGFRKLVPHSSEEIHYKHENSNGEKGCITLILCDHGDEFNHWTDDCNGRFTTVCPRRLVFVMAKS
jgi:hypothetical protein